MSEIPATSPEALANYGLTLTMQGRLGEAADACRRAVTLDRNSYIAHQNLSMALIGMGHYEEAITHADLAIAINPSVAAAYGNKAMALSNLNKLAEALPLYDRATRMQPSQHFMQREYAYALMRAGRFPEAWTRWASRYAADPTIAGADPAQFDAPFWTGETLAGKTILVISEQGNGDAIQFSRFVPILARMGAAVTFAVMKTQTPLYTLFTGVSVCSELPRGSTFDFKVLLMDIPGYLQTTVETIPDAVPYLSVLPELLAKWRERLKPYGSPRVGLIWSGNPNNPHDRRRSMPADAMQPLLARTDITFVSLNKDVRASDAPFVRTSRILDVTGDLHSYADTAAVISNLDLVLSVDTSVAHLAGALGRAVWIMLPFIAEWRWMDDRPDSPWYPTARLFRQSSPDDWPSVIAAVTTALKS